MCFARLQTQSLQLLGGDVHQLLAALGVLAHHALQTGHAAGEVIDGAVNQGVGDPGLLGLHHLELVLARGSDLYLVAAVQGREDDEGDEAVLGQAGHTGGEGLILDRLVKLLDGVVVGGFEFLDLDTECICDCLLI